MNTGQNHLLNHLNDRPHRIINLSGERIAYTINNNIIVLRITDTAVIYEKVLEGNRGNGIKIR